MRKDFKPLGWEIVEESDKAPVTDAYNGDTRSIERDLQKHHKKLKVDETAATGKSNHISHKIGLWIPQSRKTMPQHLMKTAQTNNVAAMMERKQKGAARDQYHITLLGHPANVSRVSELIRNQK